MEMSRNCYISESMFFGFWNKKMKCVSRKCHKMLRTVTKCHETVMFSKKKRDLWILEEKKMICVSRKCYIMCRNVTKLLHFQKCFLDFETKNEVGMKMLRNITKMLRKM